LHCTLCKESFFNLWWKYNTWYHALPYFFPIKPSLRSVPVAAAAREEHMYVLGAGVRRGTTLDAINTRFVLWERQWPRAALYSRIAFSSRRAQLIKIVIILKFATCNYAYNWYSWLLAYRHSSQLAICKKLAIHVLFCKNCNNCIEALYSFVCDWKRATRKNNCRTFINS